MFRMFCSVSWSVPSSIQTFVHITKVHSFFYFFVHLFLRSHIRSSIYPFVYPLVNSSVCLYFKQSFILYWEVFRMRCSLVHTNVHPICSVFHSCIFVHSFGHLSNCPPEWLSIRPSSILSNLTLKYLVHQFICSFVYLLFIPPPVFSSVRKYLSISSIHSFLRPFVHPICSSIRLNNRFVRFLDGCQGRHSNLYNHMKSVWKHYI